MTTTAVGDRNTRLARMPALEAHAATLAPLAAEVVKHLGQWIDLMAEVLPAFATQRPEVVVVDWRQSFLAALQAAAGARQDLRDRCGEVFGYPAERQADLVRTAQRYANRLKEDPTL
jgi:hypothetical protein